MIRAPQPKQRSGAALVEFATIVPFFLMILFGILEFGRYLMTLEVLYNAAREGCRYAIVNTSTTVPSPYTTQQAWIQNYTNNYLAGIGNQLTNFQAPTNSTTNANCSITVFVANPSTGVSTDTNWQDATYGQPISVKISGNYSPLIGGFLYLPSNIPVNIQVMMYSENSA